MKKLAVLFGAAVLALTSCSKNDDAGMETGAPLLLKTISTGTGPTTTITYDGNKIVTFGYETTYTYTGDLITKEEIASGTYLERVDYTYYENGNLKSRVYSNNNGEGTVFNTLEEIDYTYNADGTVTMLKHDYTFAGDTVSIISTFAKGNIVRQEEYYSNLRTAVTVYEYDTKRNPFYNIAGFNKLHEPSYCKNNLTKSTTRKYGYGSFNPTSVEVITTGYTYNDKGYPLTVQTPDYPSPTTVTYGY